jgi:hypothetical protein
VADRAPDVGVDPFEVTLEEPVQGPVDVAPADRDIEDVERDRVVRAPRDEVGDIGEDTGPYARTDLDRPAGGDVVAHALDGIRAKRRSGDQDMASASEVR